MNALSLLKSLQTFLPVATFASIITRIIIPQLVKKLGSTEINPANQNLVNIDLVWEWVPLLCNALDLQAGNPLQVLALWTGEFFPHLLSTLHAWLTQADSNEAFKEIEQWYKGWKSYFAMQVKSLGEVSKKERNRRNRSQKETSTNTSVDKKILWKRRRRALENMIQHQFKLCLGMIAARMRGLPHLAKVAPPDPNLSSFEKSLRNFKQQEDATRIGSKLKIHNFMRETTAGTTIAADERKKTTTFRDVLERLAVQNNIAFLPNIRRGRARASGKQVYLFGGVSCYIDRDVVFAQKVGAGWYIFVSIVCSYVCVLLYILLYIILYHILCAH